MSSNVILKVENVGKRYEIYEAPHHRLMQTLFRGRKQFYKEFWALKGVSFELKKGECLGIIGRNGSGKSTLLQIIAGTIAPTTGSVSADGRVAALLELGSGFNPEFTGRENVYMNGAIMGFSRAKMDKKFDEIAAFADIGEFIDQPIKIYSSGMMVRLAFAVAVSIEPEILIVDEALSVGDTFFSIKCNARIAEMQKKGVTFLFVTHDMLSVRTLCSRAMLLENGENKYCGDVLKAISFYTLKGKTIRDNDKTDLSYDGKKCETTMDYKTTVFSPDYAVVTRYLLCDKRMINTQVFEQKKELLFFCSFQLLKDLAVPYFHVSLINSKNIVVYGKDSFQCDTQHKTMLRAGDIVELRGSIELSIAVDKYVFAVALHSVDEEILSLVKKDHKSYLAEKRKVIISAKTEISVIPCSSGYYFNGVVDLLDNWECLWPT